MIRIRMRDLLQLFVVLFFCVCAFSSGQASQDPLITVVSDDGNSIIISCKIESYQSEAVMIGDEEFTRIWIPGEPVSFEKGAPALPFISRSLIIPDDQLMAVHILSVNYEDIPAKVAPSKGLLSRSIDPDSVPYEFGKEYGMGEFFPGSLAKLGEPYIMRDHRGIVVLINPFQYNPITQLLRVYREITVEVSAVGSGGKNVFHRTRTRPKVRAFEELYRSHFLNYRGSYDASGSGGESSLLYSPLDEEGDILIIAYDPWIPNVNPYVSHKIGRGFNVSVVGISTVGNDPTSIKNYIQDIYDSRDLAFVLLVGDAAQVATPTASGGASDPSYSKLAGGDNYPDIMVGRFSALTAADVDTQVLRTVEYENMPAHTTDWFMRGTGIASAQGAGQGDEGQADYVHMNEIRGWLLGFGYTLVDQIYDPSATDVMVANALNAGRGIINYCGHGSATSWGTTGFNNADVDALVNDNMLPFIISVACNNGEFNHYDKCFGEAWLRATNNSNGEPTGAIGAYMSSISQSWAPPMEAQDEFNLRYTDPAQPYSFYGTLCFAGSCAMMDKYGTGGVDMFNTWILFGDPSLRIRGPHGLDVTPASGFSTSGPAGGPYDQMNMDYTLENLESFPIDYEVTTTADWITIMNESGTIPVSGTTVVTVVLNDASRNFDNGYHTAPVRFMNLNNHDGDAMRTVALKVGMTTINSWQLDSDPGWTRQGQWEYGTPTGKGGGKGLNSDPTSGATGANVFGANLNGNILMSVGGPYYITAGPMNLTSCSEVILKYKRWLNTFGLPKVSNVVQVSRDGSSWTTYWSAEGQLAENAWSEEKLDISATANNSSSVYVRWGYQVIQKIFNSESGWNIDDVRVEGMTPTSIIHLTVEKARLTWTSIMGAVGYDVVRGDLNTLLSSRGDFTAATDSCLGNDLSGASLDYAVEPAPGQGHWFLVRGLSVVGPLTYQSLAGKQIGMRDDEINAASARCP